MTTDEMKPSYNEVEKFLTSTLKHVVHIEYYLHKLKLGANDPERPHDLVGPGNKFEWDVIKGLALAYRNPKPDFNKYILPSLEEHRKQYHHRMWNNPDPTNITKPIAEATKDDMLVGAVDAICSLLENRQYQGGKHSFDDIVKVAISNPPHKTPYMLEIIPQMQKIKEPNLTNIHSIYSCFLEDVPLNKGIEEKIYSRIIDMRNLLDTQYPGGYL